MNVILLERIRNKGNLGDIVKVKAGFARNYLFPNQKAVPANKENKAQFDTRRAELEVTANALLAAAKARANALQTLTLNIQALASEEGKLYGSIGAIEIAKAINDAGQEVSKREINMPEGPIHAIGEYTVTIWLHSDVQAQVRVSISSTK